MVYATCVCSGQVLSASCGAAELLCARHMKEISSDMPSSECVVLTAMQKKQALGAHGLPASMTAVCTLPVRARNASPSASRWLADGQYAVRCVGSDCAAYSCLAHLMGTAVSLAWLRHCCCDAAYGQQPDGYVKCSRVCCTQSSMQETRLPVKSEITSGQQSASSSNGQPHGAWARL